MSHKTVLQECPTRVSHNSDRQEYPTRVSSKSVPQDCFTRVSYKSALQECPITVSYKSVPKVLKECPHRSECHTRFPTRVRKSVPRRFPKNTCAHPTSLQIVQEEKCGMHLERLQLHETWRRVLFIHAPNVVILFLHRLCPYSFFFPCGTGSTAPLPYCSSAYGAEIVHQHGSHLPGEG